MRHRKPINEVTEQDRTLPIVDLTCKCGASNWMLPVHNLEGGEEWECKCGRWWVSIEHGDGCLIRIEPMPKVC